MDELIGQRRAAYQTQFGDFDDDEGVLARLSKIDAEMTNDLYAYIEHEAQGFMPLYAKTTRLAEWGQTLVGPQKAAGTATGSVKFTGTNGVTLDAGAALTSSAGISYTTGAAATVAGGVLTVTVTCDEAGTAGNLSTGATLTLSSPILDLSGSAIVVAPGLTGGTAAETADEYRARSLEALQAESSGGNDADYVRWAKQVAGVTDAWVVRGAAGSGELVVLFLMRGTYSDGIPVGSGSPSYSGDLLAVYNHLLESAPDPALFYVMAPVKRSIDVTIEGLSPDTTDVRAAIASELADMAVRKTKPGGVMRKSYFLDAIASAAGEDGFDDMTAPARSIVLGTYEIAAIGTVSYDS